MTKIFFVLSACLLVACGGKEQDNDRDHDHDHDHEETPDAQVATVSFDEEKALAAGLETQTVRPGTFTQAIKVSGRILAAQGDEQTLVATLPGVVALGKIAFVEGAPVKKGQTLLSLLTGKLPEGDIAVRTRAAYEKAQSEYLRAKELIKDRIISEKEFNQATADYETAQTAFEAIGGVQNGSNGVSICAPMNGYLKNLRVKEGDYVETGHPLATVSRNNRLQLRADVPEKYYNSLPAIRTAYFKTPYSDELQRLDDLNGRLVSFARSTDNDAFYIPVTFEFDNPGAILPGGYVEVYLLSLPRENTLAIPLSSLIEEQGVYSVFLREDKDCYRKQTVRPGADNGAEVEILSGLKAGEVVVTQGAYHLKLASATNALPTHHH
ncbi:MAG: efflux RND transporter periplasmic adaptor subunit [Tannerellaceae bacterium]|jgi:RND family efflux transporter MFP subunit|nr:efflux RND transporter periplasmic adaptor subunit [Tannerellaceae bacterium]